MNNSNTPKFMFLACSNTRFIVTQHLDGVNSLLKQNQMSPKCTQCNKSLWATFCHVCVRSKVTPLTSKVISKTFLGICMMPESPSSPETHTQGLEVVMALLSFLKGMITTLYGITRGTEYVSVRERSVRGETLANWVDFIIKITDLGQKNSTAEMKKNNLESPANQTDRTSAHVRLSERCVTSNTKINNILCFKALIKLNFIHNKIFDGRGSEFASNPQLTSAKQSEKEQDEFQERPQIWER